jgi:hypothetical protein
MRCDGTSTFEFRKLPAEQCSCFLWVLATVEELSQLCLDDLLCIEKPWYRRQEPGVTSLCVCWAPLWRADKQTIERLLRWRAKCGEPCIGDCQAEPCCVIPVCHVGKECTRIMLVCCTPRDCKAIAAQDAFSPTARTMGNRREHSIRHAYRRISEHPHPRKHCADLATTQPRIEVSRLLNDRKRDKFPYVLERTIQRAIGAGAKWRCAEQMPTGSPNPWEHTLEHVVGIARA